MSQAFKNLTLHEGFTNLGNFEIEITNIENIQNGINADSFITNPAQPDTVLFQLIHASGAPVSSNYTLTSETVMAHAPDAVTQTHLIAAQGYAEVKVPTFPVIKRQSNGDFPVIRYRVSGDLEARNDEPYLLVRNPETGLEVSTLISDFVVSNGELCVLIGTRPCALSAGVTIAESISALYFTTKGHVYGFEAGTNTWSLLTTLKFRSVQFPAAMLSVIDGLYEDTGSEGRIVEASLGEARSPFENFRGSLQNSDAHLVTINLSLHSPVAGDASDAETFTFTNVEPSTMRIITVNVLTTPFVTPDTSPDLEQIETLSSNAFSAGFRAFLTTSNLTSLDKLRAAGPLSFLEGLTERVTDNTEMALLQAHVDLYALNQNATQNQELISSGYDSILRIANASRNEFLGTTTTLTTMSLLDAARVHELAVQNVRLSSNLLAGALGELRMASSELPIAPGSNFVERQLAPLVNSCGCSDCKSNISPFAYLMDLLNYGAATISYSSTSLNDPPYNRGGTKVNFIALLKRKFLQPFGEFQVDCATLHDTFCRVRLVTEVLEKRVANLGSGLGTALLNQLAKDRAQYILLAYQTLLTQMGTSFREVRKVATETDVTKKQIAAKKLSDRLGLPMYVPYTAQYVVDRLWLQENSTNPVNMLTAQKLEELFGFRDTTRDVLTATPASFIEIWQSAYLRELWKGNDYFKNEYTRQGFNANQLASIDASWKPIVDPDFMGLEDITYRPGNYAAAIWENRKLDTDVFLNAVISNNTVRTAADLQQRILKVPMRDLSTHVIENNEVRLLMANNSVTYSVLNKRLNETVTDVVLEKSTLSQTQPTLFQPSGAVPTMRYMRVVPFDMSMVTVTGTAYTVNFTTPLFGDAFTGTSFLVKVEGMSGNISMTLDNVSNQLTAVSYANTQQFTFKDALGLFASFTSTTFTLYFECEVRLQTDYTIDPESFVNDQFSLMRSYNLLNPVASSITANPGYATWRDFTNPMAWNSLLGINANGLSYYERLKRLSVILNAGHFTTAHEQFISGNLRMTKARFMRLMELLKAFELYLQSSYTQAKPDRDMTYELASIARLSAKVALVDVWVQEELLYEDSANQAIELSLSKRDFWKAIAEPTNGIWDDRLQSNTLTSGATPIIDPELLEANDLLETPGAADFRNLYANRKASLEAKRLDYKTHLASLTVNCMGELLNEVNTGSKQTAFVLPANTSITSLINDLNGIDKIARQVAIDAIASAFSLSAEDFLRVAIIHQNLQLNTTAGLPNLADQEKCARLLASAYKRQQWYPTLNNVKGWIDEELSSNAALPNITQWPVAYYAVRKMKLGAVLGNTEARVAWQQALEAWSRLPFIQPDIVPIENIINFVPSNVVQQVWNARYGVIMADTTLLDASLNVNLQPAVLFTNYKYLLDATLARTGSFTPLVGLNYLPYFNALQIKEANKEDIRSNLEQHELTYEQYKVLDRVYAVLELETSVSATSTSLLVQEVNDVRDILIRIKTLQQGYAQVLEEYNMDLSLNPDVFLNYELKPDTFPLSDLPTYNLWRAPHRDRKKWKDILDGRIDLEKTVRHTYEEVLQETEDRVMPVMRDALIRALLNPCEPFADGAERLAKTYFIETKDNCCVKHTRISFAIETIQGLFFALQNGVFDDFVVNFSLYAPNFREEWKWLGSYSTWRGAMFTFLYPENILYPTLKRRQSPAFMKLADRLQNANRFSPEDACEAGKEYSRYFEDIQDLEIICTTTADFYLPLGPLSSCCDSIKSTPESTTFYFAQAKKSNKIYYSYKADADYSVNAPSFWEELPISSECNLVGCYVFGEREIVSGNPNISIYSELSLNVFYTYFNNGKLKLAYIVKDLSIPNKGWDDKEKEVKLAEVANFKPTKVYACQEGYCELSKFFMVEYTGEQTYIVNGGPLSRRKYLSGHKFVKNEDKLDGINPVSQTFVVYEEMVGTDPDYITSVHLPLKTTNNKQVDDFLIGVRGDSIVYQSFNSNSPSPSPVYLLATSLYTSAAGSNFNTTLSSSQTVRICSAIEDKENNNTLLIIIQVLTNGIVTNTVSRRIIFTATLTQSGNYTATDINYRNSHGFLMVSLNSNVPNSNSQYVGLTARVIKIFEMHGQRRVNNASCAVECRMGSFKLTFGSQISFGLMPYNYFEFRNIFNLLFDPLYYGRSVKSADCIDAVEWPLRLQAIKLQFQYTLQPPEGIHTNHVMRTTSLRDVLYEAYYFVPMLLALELQKRGIYDSALSWYRSVYDYTLNLASSRKIFYGLYLEQFAVNNYSRNLSSWLLDPLNPHTIASSRRNAYTKYTVMNIIQCLYAYADRLFTQDTIETVPMARKLYSQALDLLQVSEVNERSNACVTEIEACLGNLLQRTLGNRGWQGAIGRLQSSLERLRNVNTINQLNPQVLSLLSQANESTLPQAFADAFALIESQRPAPTPSLSIESALVTNDARTENALRYWGVLGSQAEFNALVSEGFMANVAQISGLEVNDLNDVANASRLAWLSEALPANTATYSFEFRNAQGEQNLSGNLRYNPLNPDALAYNANLVYSNAPSALGVMPLSRSAQAPSYIPLMNYVFCMPQNPVYEGLKLKGHLELYKIFNCRNIAGTIRELDSFADTTNNSAGLPVIGASGNLIVPSLGNFSPSQYRFRVVLERAKQVAQQAQQMESLFLAALEKEDAENYGLLRAFQDLQTAKATVKLQDLRIAQANSEKAMANLQLSKVSFVQGYYNNLISSGLSSHEKSSLSFLRASLISQGIASTLYTINAAINIFMPKTAIADRLLSTAQAASSISGALSIQSSILSQQASYQRRAEEWQYQSQLAGYDIGVANQQLKIAEDNIRITSQERQIAELNTDHAKDSLEFLKNKFTNAALYNWMGNVLERSYSYMLNLSTALARTAESQLYFERQEQAGPFILNDYWETPSSGNTSGSSKSNTDRRGLTGSARLLVDLTRLEQFAFESNKRKLQLSKTISLAQLFPSEFQEFKASGVLNFALTNRLFDYDFPGHYLRLIKSVKTTVVGLLPVYDGIKASLTADSISYTVIGGNTFQRMPIRRLELESVALSSPNNASGVFEMQAMQDEFLNPFEGMGIESRWEFKMPHFTNRVNYDNIADVLIQVEYTALDSYQYRYQVLQDLDNSIGFNRGFSFKNNFPDQWYELAQAQSGSNPFGVSIQLEEAFFPQGIEDIVVSGQVLLHFVREDNMDAEIEIAHFNLAGSGSNSDGETVQGTFRSNALMAAWNNESAFKTLDLAFENTAINRELFSLGQVKDILLIVPCKGDLKRYPL